MDDLVILVSFPFSRTEDREISVSSFSTVGSLYPRALTLFPKIDQDKLYNVYVELVDGTYMRADLDKPITYFQISQKPRIVFCPELHTITISSQAKQPVQLEVNISKSVSKIKEQICKSFGSVSASAFVLVHQGTVLFNNLAIPEQIPGAETFELVDANSENTKINFMDLYVRGPVYLPFSDALQLSAYLLQASVGPARSYTGQISELVAYLPERFKDQPGAAVDLHLEWTFLNSVNRMEALKQFVQKVQALPLFNCVSFTASRPKEDKTSNLPDHFEVIYTERRIILLDYFKFKTRGSIDFADLLSIKREGTETITFTYSQDGITTNKIRFNSPTSKTIVHKTVSIVTGVEVDNLQNEYSFRTCEDIATENKTTRPALFSEDYILQFVTQDETESRLSNADLMHALLIRADSCAWHLSVLLDKVNVNTAKVLKDEISAYYSRLMAYLKYLTYDIRPYDHAWEIGRLLCCLDTQFPRANVVIRDVLTNLSVVRRSFVPISSDPIYVTSRAVVAYALSHLLSCMELPFATTERRVDAFTALVTQFLNNGLELKDLIQKYLFSVGDIDLKKSLQIHLDFIFRHHLTSLVLFPLITSNSQFRDVDPSIILHQDSCNTMMTSMIEFSRVLWEDRKKLPDTHLKEFLSQAAELCRQLLSENNQNGIIVKTVQEFSKVVVFNLPGLFAEHRTLFSMLLPAINTFIDSYNRSKSMSSSPVVYDMLTVISLLVLDQPEVLAEEATILLTIFGSTLGHVYEQFTNDIELFELDTEEGRNQNICALKCYVQDNVVSDVEDKSPNEIIQLMAPSLALSAMVQRQVSEYCGIFIKFFSFYKFYIHALVYRSLYLINQKVEQGLSITEETKKLLSGLKVITDVEYLIPSGRIITDLETALLIAQDPSISSLPEGTILSSLRDVEVTYPSWDELVKKPEYITIMTYSSYIFSQITLSSALMALGIDSQRVMLTFPTSLFGLTYLIDALRQLSKCPGYFEVPRYFMKLQIIVNGFLNNSKVLFASCTASTGFTDNVNQTAALLKAIPKIISASDLTGLTPLIEYMTPELPNPTLKADHRLDMASIMGEYRISKNEFIDCMILREKENAENMLNPLVHSCQSAIQIVKYLDSSSSLPTRIVNGIEKFFNSLSRIWTYRLTQLHIRDELEELDAAFDEAVDLVATKMYEPATLQKLQFSIAETCQMVFTPHERAEFVQSFLSALLKITDSQTDDELIEILHEMLMLLRDNSLYELKNTSESLGDDNIYLMPLFENSKYCQMVIDAEEALEKLKYINGYVWFELSFAELVQQIKANPYNKDTVEGIEILTSKVNSSFAPTIQNIALIQNNVETSTPLLNYPIMATLKEQCDRAAKNVIILDKKYSEFTETVLKNTAFSGNSLIYKDAVLQIISSFYHEFLLQDWDPEGFADICLIVTNTLLSDYSSSPLSTSLLNIRRNLRSIRLHKPTVHPRFITDTEKTLNDLEKSLLQAYRASQQKINQKIEKQTTIIKGYVNTLVKAPNGQIKNFVVRLINNLALDITSFRLFEADQMARGIARLYEGLKATNSKADHINHLIKWLENIDHGVLPVDVDELLEILKQIRMKLKRSEDSLFDYNESAMINIAIGLSDALAKLAKIRESLDLVKSMHRLSPMKETLANFIITIMRSLEAYADEIHTFRDTVHPVLGIIKSVPEMCNSIEELIESTFMLHSNMGQLANVCIDRIKDFIKSCPDDLMGITEKEATQPIKMLSDFAIENQAPK